MIERKIWNSAEFQIFPLFPWPTNGVRWSRRDPFLKRLANPLPWFKCDLLLAAKRSQCIEPSDDKRFDRSITASTASLSSEKGIILPHPPLRAFPGGHFVRSRFHFRFTFCFKNCLWWNTHRITSWIIMSTSTCTCRLTQNDIWKCDILKEIVQNSSKIRLKGRDSSAGKGTY